MILFIPQYILSSIGYYDMIGVNTEHSNALQLDLCEAVPIRFPFETPSRFWAEPRGIMTSWHTGRSAPVRPFQVCPSPGALPSMQGAQWAAKKMWEFNIALNPM